MGGFTPETCTREEASEGDLDLPIRAAVLATSRIDGWRRLFHHWSGRGLEPLTCLLLAPVEGAAALEQEALTLGYRHIVRASLHGNHEVDSHPRLSEALAYLQSHDYSLVPLIARELGGRLPRQTREDADGSLVSSARSRHGPPLRLLGIVTSPGRSRPTCTPPAVFEIFDV